MSDYGSSEERVARGAAWQDEHKPGWERSVDVSALRMSSRCQCILGQSWAEDAIASRLRSGYEFVLWNGPPRCENAIAWTISHGFYTNAGPADYRALEAAWVALLKERFDSGLLSDAAGEGMEG